MLKHRQHSRKNSALARKKKLRVSAHLDARRRAVCAKHRTHSKPPRVITESDFAAIVAQAARDDRWVVPAACDDEGRLIKHPVIGYSEFADKRPVPKRIELWLCRFPTRGGLYLTGALSGFFVIDCDSPAAIRWLIRMGIPLTQIVRTRRGWHVYFRWPKFPVRNSASRLHPGIDVRGVGGVVVAVGSVHESGFVYQWRRGHSPRDVKIAKAPRWLLDWLKRQNEAREAAPAAEARPFQGEVHPWAKFIIDAELAALAEAPDGTRNDALCRTAYGLGRLVGGGEAELEAVRAALHNIAREWPNAQHSVDTVNRGLKDGQLQPRQRPQGGVRK